MSLQSKTRAQAVGLQQDKYAINKWLTGVTFYTQNSLGYSSINVSSTLEESDTDSFEVCGKFCIEPSPATYRDGGSAKGFGYRLAYGHEFLKDLRLEFSYMNIGGDANGLPEGSVGAMKAVGLSLHYIFVR